MEVDTPTDSGSTVRLSRIDDKRLAVLNSFSGSTGRRITRYPLLHSTAAANTGFSALTSMASVKSWSSGCLRMQTN